MSLDEIYSHYYSNRPNALEIYERAKDDAARDQKRVERVNKAKERVRANFEKESRRGPANEPGVKKAIRSTLWDKTLRRYHNNKST